MPIKTQPLEYQDGSQTCIGYMAWDDGVTGTQPAVLVNHAWGGLDDFAKDKARGLAALGYVGIALDNYGDGDTPETVDDKMARMNPLVENREKLRDRLIAGYDAAATLPIVDETAMAAMGFCFGGLCTLDMARAGLDLRAAISFHGLLDAPDLPTQDIKAEVLVCHGWNDPMSDPADVVKLGEELGKADCNWTLMGFGRTKHAFMVPDADNDELGLKYNEHAATQAWMATQDLLSRHFALQGTR